MKEDPNWLTWIAILFPCQFIGVCFSVVARLPFEANSYIKVVPNQVLAPVIESVRVLGKEEIDEILCSCFSVFITSLMDFILEESFKFRYVWISSEKYTQNHASLSCWKALSRFFINYNCQLACIFKSLRTLFLNIFTSI